MYNEIINWFLNARENLVKLAPGWGEEIGTKIIQSHQNKNGATRVLLI